MFYISSNHIYLKILFLTLSTCGLDLPKPSTHPELLTNPYPLGTQSTLGARHLTLLTGYSCGSSLDSDGKSLEGTLSTVVVVVTVEAVNVECNTGTLSKALKAVRNHLGAESTEPLALQAEVNDAVRTVGKIDDSAREGLIERSVGVAETSETGGCTEGLGEGVTKSDADIFGGVVVVNWVRSMSVINIPRWRSREEERTVKITLAVQSQTPASMLSQSMEHVVEEANSSVDSNLLGLAGLRGMAILIVEKTGVSLWREIAAVEVKSELDLSLVGVTGESSPSGLRKGHICESIEYWYRIE